MEKYIIEEFRKRKNPLVIQVPISEITQKFPILLQLWNEYKGMCNYGTNPINQTNILNKLIQNNSIFSEMKKDVMVFPNKKNYLDFETNSTYKNKSVLPIDMLYNEVWNVRNAKYQHLVNGVSFPDYYWDKKRLDEMTKLGIEARGNFYYPKGGFREWHTNVHHPRGYRMYFITCPEDNKSWFNYIDPKTNKVYNLPDKNEYANIFYVYNDINKVIWHSIYSETDRFSLGFNISSI